MRIMPPVEAYNEDLFRNVLKAFDNIDERANEKERLWLRFHGGCQKSPILIFRNGKRARCSKSGTQSCPRRWIEYGGGIPDFATLRIPRFQRANFS